jgi:N-methylhydantoinase A
VTPITAKLRIGIDTGGTFTDIVAADETTGAIVTTKTPSTPADPSQGFITGLMKVLEAAGAAPSDVTAVSHGTTVATNALLQEEFPGLGFITTKGFRHVLEIARQSVPEGYGNSYFWVKPERIVPLHHVREVTERIGAGGETVIPLDEQEARLVARWFREIGITSVGICFLNAYVAPEHERMMRDVLAEEYPDCSVSISSDVLREYREYERSVTTLVDAFVKPLVAGYVHGIKMRLDPFTVASEREDLPFYVMKSNGGVMSAAEVDAAPITTILSGPAAGVLGAIAVGKGAGFDQVLTLDGGGTSTDVSVVAGDHPILTTEGAVGRFPVKVPMVDIVTVGTGGGSIAWAAADGGLKVGPHSAGADPGPMCYSKGGTEPTATDAHLLLGRLPPALLGGEIPLDVGVAREGLERLATAVGMDVEACAAGVLEIAAWNQANAIRQVTVRRGLDVRDFGMLAFGGSGPLLACKLIDVLALKAAIVPPDPGNLSAFGLLTVDVRNDYVQTFVRRIASLDASETQMESIDSFGIMVAGLREVYAGLRTHAADSLSRAGFGTDDHVFALAADLRYFGQAFEVRVAAPPGHIDENWVSAVVGRFHDEHERLYGYCYRNDPTHVVEWVNARAAGIGEIAKPAPRKLPRAVGDVARALRGTRSVYFDDGWIEASVYDRAALGAGDSLEGPCVIEEYGSTTPIAPGFGVRVDDLGNLIVTAG